MTRMLGLGHLVGWEDLRDALAPLLIGYNIGNRYSPITIVAAITSKFDEELYPTEVLVSPPEGGLLEPSVVALNQIRSVDKQRLVKRLGVLKPATMARVDQALRVSASDAMRLLAGRFAGQRDEGSE